MRRTLKRWLARFPDAAWWHAFGWHLWRRFLEDNCLLTAGMLAYTTLLAVVPLTAVTLAVISAFPVFDAWSGLVQEFIFDNFVPTAGEVVQRYINEFANKATQLTAAGVLLLVFIAVLLMWNVERTLNRIWRVTTPRRLVNRFMVYWSALTLGPLLIGASLAISSYLVSLPLVSEAASTLGLRSRLIHVAPFAASLAAFTLLYVMVPNRSVRIRNALAGGLLAAVLFELAKRAFGFYVTNFPTYEHIYGTLATIPIFLIWVYLSWVVILLGASFAASLDTFQYLRYAEGARRQHDFVLLYRIAGHLWEAQRRGGTLTLPELARREPAAEDQRLTDALARLNQAGLARSDEEGHWALLRDFDEVTLLDLYRAGGVGLPLTDEVPDGTDRWDRALSETLGGLGGRLEKDLGVPLRRMFAPEAAARRARD